MPANAKWKRRVRARMAETGQTYTEAMRDLQAEIAERERQLASQREQADWPSSPASPFDIAWQAPAG